MKRPRVCTLKSFAWPIVALAVFAGLQVWRIAVYDEIQRSIRPGFGTTVAPGVISRLGLWTIRAANAAARDDVPTFQLMPSVRRVHQDHPMLVATAVGYMAALAAAGWAGAVALGWWAGRRGRWVPCVVTRRERWLVAIHGVDRAWPWGLALGAALGGAAWYITFDREGGSRPLLRGLLPRPVGVAGMGAAWALLMGIIARRFLATAAKSLGILTPESAGVCRRCRYPLDGLPSGACPECGAPFEKGPVIAPSPRACHVRTVRTVAVLIAATAAIGAAAAAVPRARPWLMLLPSDQTWIHVADLPTDGRRVMAPHVHGRLALSARLVDRKFDAYEITWEFTPHLPAGSQQRSGSFHVMIPTLDVWGFIDCELEFGDLRLCRLGAQPDVVQVQISPLLTPGRSGRAPSGQ